MLGRHPGYVPTQGQILADLFRTAGYAVLDVSSKLNRYARLADMVTTLTRRRSDLDILILDTFGGRSFVVEDIVSRLGRAFHKPLIMFLHGGEMPEFMAHHPRWTRRVLNRADRLLTPSNFLARALAGFGMEARIIPNVVNMSEYPFRLREEVTPRLFWMRAFHPIYNPAMAVRVLARLRSVCPEATLVMAGQEKGLEMQTRQMAEELGLKDAVRFAGFLDAEGKAREGTAADIFLNTNRIDNAPVSVVEACAMGLPVVATAVGGVPDLLTDGETGLLVPDDDDVAMAAAVQRLLTEPGLAGNLSANGRNLAKCRSWERIRSQWEQVFAQVMAKQLS